MLDGTLAGKDPSKKTPFQIELYLEQNKTFRSRVLKQFTNYRTEWRNPSTHDYKLDFDNSEAFLAIVSVTAFACVLLDEISERLSFLKSQAQTQPISEEIRRRVSAPNLNLAEAITNAIQEFASYRQSISDGHRATEIQILGALHGFISTTFPDIEVRTEVPLDSQGRFRVDMLLRKDDDSVLIEVKRNHSRKNYQNSLVQVGRYMMLGNIKNGILVFFSDEPGELEVKKYDVTGINGLITIMMPANEA